MARARILKPDTHLDPDLNALPPLVRWLFVGLWGRADRLGRLEDDPRRIKVEVVPYDDLDVDAALALLDAGGFVLRYAADGRDYLQITNFVKHQNPHPKEAPSTISAPPRLEKTRKRLKAVKLHDEQLTSREKVSTSNADPVPSVPSDPVPNSGVVRTLEPPKNGGALVTCGPPHLIKEALTVYDELFRERTGEKPNITAADCKLLKTLIARHGALAVADRLRSMFASQDSFIANSGCTIGVLSSCWNKLAIQAHPPPTDGLSERGRQNQAAGQQYLRRVGQA